MENKTISLELTPQELQLIIDGLGELPTRFNAWPLAMKLMPALSKQEQEGPTEE